MAAVAEPEDGEGGGWALENDEDRGEGDSWSELRLFLSEFEGIDWCEKDGEVEDDEG